MGGGEHFFPGIFFFKTFHCFYWFGLIYSVGKDLKKNQAILNDKISFFFWFSIREKNLAPKTGVKKFKLDFKFWGGDINFFKKRYIYFKTFF